jgi:hypothetical protein
VRDFHDLVDELVNEDGLRDRRFAGPGPSDTIMTTWHDNESLEEALEFFRTCAIPTDGLLDNSDFGLVVCVNNEEWSTTALRVLHAARVESHELT